jgi:hypothetical protein
MTINKLKIMNKIKKLIIEIKTIENLSNAYAKKVAKQKDYMTMMVTVTFGNTSNARIAKYMRYKYPEKYLELLEKQYKSLMFLIKKLRKTKRIKHKIHYFGVFELQPQTDNLHLHLSLSIHKSDLLGFINFIYWYKKQNFKGFYNIGRTHIGLSAVYKNVIENKFRLTEVKDKKNPDRITYIINDLENRDFYSGEATFWEFVSASDLEERYNENFINYIKKTLVATGLKKEEIMKLGVLKNWNNHNLKEVLNIENIETIDDDFRKDVNTIREIGQVYTYSYSTFSLSFRLYQDNYTRLKKFKSKYGSYYNADKDYELGILTKEIIKNLP